MKRDDSTFVITVPEENRSKLAYKINARTTHGVLIQLIANSQHSLVLAAPYLRSSALENDKNLVSALSGALSRGVKIDIVSTWQSFQSINLKKIDGYQPELVKLYQPVDNQKIENSLGSHAKFYISDQTLAYIGSANLTYLGLNQNLEMGVLLNGNVAHQIFQFWKYLCEIGFFKRIKEN